MNCKHCGTRLETAVDIYCGRCDKLIGNALMDLQGEVQ